MPGFSEACSSGKHAACVEAVGVCRCSCHPYTQELLRKDVIGKPYGPKSKRGKNRQSALAPVQALPEPAGEELQNTCETCGKKHPSTKHFCTDCGAKLALGTLCQRCEGVCDALDKFCGECGWRLAEPIPPEAQELAPARVNPMPDIPSRLEIPPVDGDPTNGKPAPLPPGIAVRAEVLIEETPVEDPLLRLKRQAQEQGLLPRPVTNVS